MADNPFTSLAEAIGLRMGTEQPVTPWRIVRHDNGSFQWERTYRVPMGGGLVWNCTRSSRPHKQEG